MSIFDSINAGVIDNAQSATQDQILDGLLTTVKKTNKKPVIPQSLVGFSKDKQVEQAKVEIAQKKKKSRRLNTKKKLQQIADNVKQQVIHNQQKQQNLDGVQPDQTGLTPFRQLSNEQQKQQIQQAIIDISTQQEVSDVVEVLEDENNVNLEGTDAEVAVAELAVELADIPGGEDIEISDIEIKPTKIVDKEGRYRTKINIKKNNMPPIVNDISSDVVIKTKGLIKPRVVDMRVIGNTNKTQLRGSNLLLTTRTIVFKPDHTRLKVNKGTRIMISIPETNEENQIIVYIQESRAKKILVINKSDFSNYTLYIDFISKTISNYYTNGFNVTLNRLMTNGTENPFMELIEKVVGTRQYKAGNIYSDDSDDSKNNLTIVGVTFKTKSTDEDSNSWLSVVIRESNENGLYDVIAFDTVTNSEWSLYSKKTIQFISKNILTLLENTYNRDWSAELDEASNGADISIYRFMNSLQHKKLKKFLTLLWETNESQPEIGIKIGGVLTQEQLKKIGKYDYNMEAVVFKTNKLEKCIVSYYAHLIKGGDKRNGKDYITSQSYYQRSNVNDRNQYQKRKRTILAREGENRNYNSRPYIFQVEYTINGKSNLYRSLTLTDLLSKTGILTDNPALNVKNEIL